MYVACTLTTLKDVPKLIATSRACHQRVGRHARARAAVRTLPSPRLASGRSPCPPAARGWLRGPRGGRAPRPFAPWGPRPESVSSRTWHPPERPRVQRHPSGSVAQLTPARPTGCSRPDADRQEGPRAGDREEGVACQAGHRQSQGDPHCLRHWHGGKGEARPRAPGDDVAGGAGRAGGPCAPGPGAAALGRAAGQEAPDARPQGPHDAQALPDRVRLLPPFRRPPIGLAPRAEQGGRAGRRAAAALFAARALTRQRASPRKPRLG